MADLKAQTTDLKQLVAKQRELNDAQTKARRAAWDRHLERVNDTEEAGRLLRELAANPQAW